MTASRFNRLKWLCRRGMKELDVLLENFLALYEQQLRDGSWPELEKLLESEDDLLWDCLQQPASTQASPFREVLEKIRCGSG
jgi:antitoxin CptB